MKRVLIIRYGEIALKGLNKSYFEKKLIQHIKSNLEDFSPSKIWKSNGLIFATMENVNEDEFIERVKRVFGIVSVSPAYEFDSSLDNIKKAALKLINEKLESYNFKSFKVETRRGNKSFPLNSPEISREVGGFILRNTTGLHVDVHNPECYIYVDVREKSYVYTEKIAGYGGLPIGTNGKAMLLLSGGIDSPVAGWMIAKRGVEIEAVHYHSYPFTSERAKEKVTDLAKILSRYCGTIRVNFVNLLSIQKEINEKCPEEEMTILSRRFMMKIAEKIAQERGCNALVTGESIGQVASQTIQGLTVTNNAVEIPVLRPLIAADKVDIIEIAKKIDTYETSILPFEDCCTVFLPKRPVTKPKLEKILKSEGRLDVERLVKEAIETVTIEEFN